MQEFLTVTALNQYINRLLENDEFLQDCWLKGEISGCKLYQQSGHLYFTLKDEESSVSCVMFKSRGRHLKFKPQDGQEVLLRGSLAVFGRQGRYQVYVQEMQPFGVGGILLLLERLKRDLESKGYFAPENKKQLPALANRIGIVTSQDGAALRDMVRILKQRHHRVDITLVHSAVQGAEAPRELARGISLLNRFGRVDIIIIGRGGGALEDLMAFNTEEVVKAIYESQIPVISAVGHEIDFTLADLAADMRAATPSQAAQFAVPDMSALEQELLNRQKRMRRAIERRLHYWDECLDRITSKRLWREPEALLKSKWDALQTNREALIKLVQDGVKEKENQFVLAARSLDTLSPLKVMERGYAVVSKEGHVVKSGNEAQIGDHLTVALNDADLMVVVESKELKLRYG